MKPQHTKPLYSKKELITKEIVRGHLRNWLCEIFTKKGITDNYTFVFEMENIAFKSQRLVWFDVNRGYSNIILTFYIDNIMRSFLGLNELSYLEATKPNLMKLKKMLKPVFKELTK